MGELVAIIATHKITHEERFQCERCVKQKAPPEQILKIRNSLGCFGSRRELYTLEGFRFKSCIGNFYSAAAFFWYRNFRDYQRGILPYPGSLLEQPAKAIEIFQIFESLEAKRFEELERNKDK